MKLLSKDELKNLMEYEKGPCLSIYMPGHRGAGPPEIRQDQIRLKNLIREARERLLANGDRPQEVDELLSPVVNLYEDDGFWLEQSNGIALFSAPGMFRYYRLPINFDGLE